MTSKAVRQRVLCMLSQPPASQQSGVRIILLNLKFDSPEESSEEAYFFLSLNLPNFSTGNSTSYGSMKTASLFSFAFVLEWTLDLDKKN